MAWLLLRLKAGAVRAAAFPAVAHHTLLPSCFCPCSRIRWEHFWTTPIFLGSLLATREPHLPETVRLEVCKPLYHGDVLSTPFTMRSPPVEDLTLPPGCQGLLLSVLFSFYDGDRSM